MSVRDTVSAQAHVRSAHVKAAPAAGRSQNKVRESLEIPLLPADVEDEPVAAKSK